MRLRHDSTAWICAGSIMLAFQHHGAKRSAKQDPWVSVALVDGMGIPMENAVNVLKSAGIESFEEGSRSYGVFVKRSDRSKANAAIIADAKLRPYEYSWIGGFQGKLGFSDDSKWPVRKFDLNLNRIDSDPEMRVDANLRGLGREATHKLKEWWPDSTKSTPYLKSARLFPTEYTDSSGHTKVGYKAVLDIGFRGENGTLTLDMWSWDDGRKHTTRSGGGTLPSPGDI